MQGFIYTLEQANKRMAPFGEPADGQLRGGKEEQEQELALIHRRAIPSYTTVPVPYRRCRQCNGGRQTEEEEEAHVSCWPFFPLWFFLSNKPGLLFVVFTRMSSIHLRMTYLTYYCTMHALALSPILSLPCLCLCLVLYRTTL